MEDNDLSWNIKYGLNIKLNSNLNDYINIFQSKIKEKNMENKIDNMEKDYQNRLYNLEKLCESQNEIKNIKSKNSLVILQKELEIIKLLTKYTLQNKNLNYNFFILCLKILLDLSETLRVRLNQKELINDNKINKDNYISRCSYKFCSYQDNCSFNYNTNYKSKSVCYQDHYVHNMVSSDLKILINYIDSKYIDNVLIHDKEILKTINTLSYVISHMEIELKNKCLYLPESKWELCHYIKNK
jgi:hypothetical protein